MFHELLHVGIEPGPEGSEIYSVRKHDLEDFKLIIDKYGTEWSKTATDLINTIPYIHAKRK